MLLNADTLALESPESFATLGASIDALTDDGVLHDNEAVDAHPVRLRIARTYLFLLGYLKSDNGKGERSSEFVAAVRSFQSEAALPVTADLDLATWQKLQMFARFDQQRDVSMWLANPAITAVLERAVRLRLFAYGLLTVPPHEHKGFETKTTKREKKLQNALVDFVRLCARLRLHDELLAPDMNAPTLTLLFDHVGLIRALRGTDRGFHVFAPHPDHPAEEKHTKKLVQIFIRNLAAVELWLLGYDIRPGNFKPEGVHGRDNDGTLNDVLNKFARDRGIKVQDKDAIRIGIWFFEDSRRIEEDEKNETVNDEELDRLLTDDRQLKKLRKSYKSLGARIIEGVRRAFSWVAGWFRKAFRALAQLLRNLARVLHGAALWALRQVKNLVRVVRIGLDYFFRRKIGGSDPDVVYGVKGADFDLDIVINPSSSTVQRQAFFTELDMRVRAMELGSLVLGRLFDILRFVLRATNVAVEWLGLLISLTKIGNWLRGSVELLREVNELIAKIDEAEKAAI